MFCAKPVNIFNLIIALALVACGATSTRTPTPTTLVIPLSPLPRATFTPRPRATPTRKATATARATVTQTPTPTIPQNTVVELGTLPPGFSLTTYAEVLGPTSLAFGPDGRLYVASTNAVVYAFADTDGDHRADARQTFAWEVPVPLGLLWITDTLYISYQGHVQAVRDTDGDGQRDWMKPILTNLPNGRHQNDGMALGPDGYIYLGIGSTCDVCTEADWRSASVVRFTPAGKDLSVVARGLRNPYDVAFNAAGDLFATDNGRDDLGTADPPEELNHLRDQHFYGWPSCWEGSTAERCATQTHAVVTFTARTSADGLVFYTGESFPPAYHGDAFVAVLGSYVYPELARGVMRVRLTPDGETYMGETEWFLQLSEGRPLDVTVGPDGGLYVADYGRGAIYRIVYGAP